MSVSGYSSLRRVSSPWLMLPPSFSDGGMSYNFYSLAENRVFSLKKKSNLQSESPSDAAEIVGSSHGWLALYNRRDRSLFLSNPVTGEHIRLPPVETLGSFSGIGVNEEENYRFVKRVILSAPPHQQDCRAIVTFSSSFYSQSTKLAICSPRRSSSWTTIHCYDDVDIVYSTKDRLFSILLESRSYDIVRFDCTDPSGPKEIDEPQIYFRYLDHNRSGREMKVLKPYWSWPKRHLVYVEHTDQLLLVRRHSEEPSGSLLEYPNCKTVVLDVYLIDTATGGLQYMEDSLDGLALFVGLNYSFALQAADYPELKPDSIYFTEAKPFDWPMSCPDYKYGGDDIGIFDYKNKTFSSCYYPCDHRSFMKIYPSPLWFTPSPH